MKGSRKFVTFEYYQESKDALGTLKLKSHKISYRRLEEAAYGDEPVDLMVRRITRGHKSLSLARLVRTCLIKMRNEYLQITGLKDLL